MQIIMEVPKAKLGKERGSEIASKYELETRKEHGEKWVNGSN